MKLKKPVEVKLYGETVEVITLRSEGKITIKRKDGIKDIGYIFEEISIDDQKKVLNRAGYYYYDY